MKKTLLTICCTGLVLGIYWIAATPEAEGFNRYQDGCNDAGCHGDFTGPTSPKGTVFPGDDKHNMHRAAQQMNTDCALCHLSGDNRNPYIWQSDGTSDNPGLGCTGCHEEFGLRLHHVNNGLTFCADCHTGDLAPPSEDTPPPYYGTADTNADDPCNSSGAENWSVGDTQGLDNDGDNDYDQADQDCTPDLCGNGTVNAGEDCDPSVTGTVCCASDCTFEPLGTTCDDGFFCTVTDTCDEAGFCGGQPRDCSDGVACTSDGCNEAPGECVNTPNDANCPDDALYCNGTEFCHLVNDCSSTGDPCDPATEICNEGTDSCDPIAECGNGVVEPGEDCDGGVCCASDCTYESAGFACGDQGVECLVDDACDGAGACVDGGNQSDGTACGSASDTECDNADTCLAGSCEANNESAGFACGDQGVECLVDDACDGAGVCVDGGNQSDGTACGSASDTECDNADTCLAGSCVANNESAGFACGDQGVECLVDDACDGAGVCVDGGNQSDGTACGSASDTECDNADTCLAGSCEANNESAGFACGDQGVECLVDDACDGAGACTDNGFEPNGTACGSASDTSCDNADTCDGAGVCELNYEPVDTPCPDGEFCNGDELCDGVGTCDAGVDPCDPATETCNEGTNSCDPIGECGNGVVDPGEDCDGTVCCAANCTWESAGAACGDQGVECLVDDACNGAGVCVDGGNQSDGTACGSASDTECDNADTCLAGSCEANNESAGFACGDQGVECLADDACDGAGACTDNGFEPNGTACGSASDTSCDNADTCNGAGVCELNYEPTDTPCPDAEFCNGEELCDGVGTCDAGVDPCDPATETCNEGTNSCDPIGECGNGVVDPGEDCDGTVCCAANCTWESAGAACGDQGVECLVDDACNGAGVCVDGGNQSDGTACGSASDTECDNADTCLAGSCEANNESAGFACGDQGVECLVDDACDGAGACTDNGFEPNGTACGSASDTSCDNADTCNGAGVCELNYEPVDTPCPDAEFCNGDELCDGAGTCDPGVDPCDPATETCNEGTDTCDPIGECGNGVVDPGEDCDGTVCCASDCTYESAGAACGDQGVECLVDDACNGAGVCVDGGNQSDGTACGSASDTECDNADTCLAGSCEANNESAGFACGDQGVECLVDDACDGAGACTDNGFEPNGIACGSASDTSCDNADTCNGAGVCELNYEPVDTPCPDAEFCNGDELCDGAGTCDPGVDPCDPATETCNEGTDTCDPIGECGNGVVDPGEDCDGTVCCASDCTYESAGAACGDQGVECLVDDACNGAGVCVDGGNQSDGTACGSASDTECDNADTCLAGSCEANNESAGFACGDQGVECLVDDACDGAGACTDNGFEPNGIACGSASDTSCDNADTCNGAGVCELNYEPVDTPCPDAEFCNGDELCDGAGTCDPGVDPCDPATETCNEGTDTCDPIGCTSDEDCDDGLFCNGTETCDQATGQCVAVSACPPAQDGCVTRGAECDEENDICIDFADDSLCDDGAYCNGAETCDIVTTACLPGTPVDCSDGVGCTDDSCNEATDSCDNLANDANCSDDGLFCNGIEFCDPVADCSSSGDPCPAGEICNEGTDVCEAPPVVIDLDIAQFQVTKRVRLSSKRTEVAIKLVVKNNGDFNDQTRPATVTGMRGSTMVYTETRDVADPVGNGRSRYDFTSHPVSEAGDIMWRVEIFDDDPDDDEATAVTQVVP